MSSAAGACYRQSVAGDDDPGTNFRAVAQIRFTGSDARYERSGDHCWFFLRLAHADFCCFDSYRRCEKGSNEIRNHFHPPTASWVPFSAYGQHSWLPDLPIPLSDLRLYLHSDGGVVVSVLSYAGGFAGGRQEGKSYSHHNFWSAAVSYGWQPGLSTLYGADY